MTAERDEIRLRVTPAGQRRRPLLCAAKVENLLARLDHAAVEGAGDHLGHFVRRHRDHDLVEQGHSLDRPSLRDQRPGLNVAGKRNQIDVLEPFTDLRRLTGDRAGALPVARDCVLQGQRHQQMSLLRAVVVLAIVQQPACTRKPATGTGEFAAIEEDEDDPARASGGRRDVTRAQLLLMRALPQLDAVLIPADEVRRGRQAPEVLRLERDLPVCGRELRKRIAPGAPVKGLPAAGACLCRRHARPLPHAEHSGRFAHRASARSRACSGPRVR